MVIFTSCKSINQHYEFYDSHCGIITNSINGDYYQIHSREEKNAFLHDYCLNIEFKILFNKYCDNYFLTKIIVILVMPTSSSSIHYSLIDMNVGDEIEFKIKKKRKEISNDDLVNKAFIVEYSRELSHKNCKISFIK